MMLRKSPASSSNHFEFANRENGIVVDNNKLIMSLPSVAENTDEQKLFWDHGFRLYLSQCRSKLYVEYDRELVLVYQMQCSPSSDQFNITTQYGIGPLPRDLILKPKRNRFSSIREREHLSSSRCKLKPQSELPKNFFKSCFGLYCTTRKLRRSQHWKLVGIPQMHVLFSVAGKSTRETQKVLV